MNCTDFLAGIAAILWGIKWLNVALIVAILYGAYLLYRLNSSKSKFSIDDLLLTDGKADNRKLNVLVFAALSVWVIVTEVQHDKPVDVLLPIILGIFVGSKVLTDIYGGKPPPDGK